MVAMALNEGLIYTNGNCIGCNRCISGCRCWAPIYLSKKTAETRFTWMTRNVFTAAAVWKPVITMPGNTVMMPTGFCWI